MTPRDGITARLQAHCHRKKTRQAVRHERRADDLGGAAEVKGAAGDEAVRDAIEHLDDVPENRTVRLAVGHSALGAGSLAPDLVDGAAASP